MPRCRNLAPILAALLVAPVAMGSAPAGAIEQDLVLSVASGGPGTRLEVTSASCVSDVVADDEGNFTGAVRSLEVRLISGDLERVLAGLGVASVDAEGNDGPAVLVVPDWLDPDAPAALEATCYELTLGDDDFEEREAAYDPVPFDVEPAAAPPVQTVALSRTELRTGQGLTAEIVGCTLDGATSTEVAVVRGADRSGANLFDVVAYGAGESVDPASVEILLNDATWWVGFSLIDDELVDLEVDEQPNTIVPGPHTAYPMCFAEEGEQGSLTLLAFEPQAIEVTDTSPTDDLDLVVAPGTRSYELSGGSCDQPEVRTLVEVEPFDERLGFAVEAEPGERVRRAVGLGRFLPGAGAEAWPAARRSGPSGPSGRSGASGVRQLRSGPISARTFVDDLLTDEVPVGGDGTWAQPGVAPLDWGAVSALAVCGDPFGDGFAYDPQVAVVDVEPTSPPVAPPEAEPVPPAPPADAIAGTPRYTG